MKILHDTFNRTFGGPFSVLDIACGDASEMQRALAGTKTRHYHGVDLSEPALELAANNPKDLLMIYELTRVDGESRNEYLERFRRVNRPAWTMLPRLPPVCESPAELRIEFA